MINFHETFNIDAILILSCKARWEDLSQAPSKIYSLRINEDDMGWEFILRGWEWGVGGWGCGIVKIIFIIV